MRPLVRTFALMFPCLMLTCSAICIANCRHSQLDWESMINSVFQQPPGPVALVSRCAWRTAGALRRATPRLQERIVLEKCKTCIC